MRFDDEFLQIFMIFGRFEAPILRRFGTKCCKKRGSEKIMQKGSKKGSAGHAGKRVVGAVGPLKQDNQTAQQWHIDPNTPWRA